MAAALTVGYIRVQDEGTAVCVKLSVNSQDEPWYVNAVVDDRTLRELYLKPLRPLSLRRSLGTATIR